MEKMCISKKTEKNFHAVIPAGGTGTRLWPLSRVKSPKFLHDLTGSGNTLLRATYDRLVPLAGDNNIMVVTGVPHRQAVLEQLSELSDQDLVLENEPKDSAAAIGLAAAILYRRDPDCIMGSFAADHVITPVAAFHEAVTEAIATAAQGYIVTIGIKPTYPATAFGYIRVGGSLGFAGADHARRVEEFVEKPDEGVAQQYVNSGNYQWNAGMFVAPVALMLQHLEENEPELYAGINAIADARGTAAQQETMDRIWKALPKTAIDYAVAEPAAAVGDVAVVPADFSWDDVGDFVALGRLNVACDRGGVTAIGAGARVFNDDATGVVVSDTKRVIALVGIDDVVVVDTPDALLITTKEHSQRVKGVVNSLEKKGYVDVL